MSIYRILSCRNWICQDFVLCYEGQASETFFQNLKYFLRFPHIPVYLGPDKNTIISVSQNCLASTDSLIEISKDKYPANTTTYLLKQQYKPVKYFTIYLHKLIFNSTFIDLFIWWKPQLLEKQN